MPELANAGPCSVPAADKSQFAVLIFHQSFTGRRACIALQACYKQSVFTFALQFHSVSSRELRWQNQPPLGVNDSCHRGIFPPCAGGFKQSRARNMLETRD